MKLYPCQKIALAEMDDSSDKTRDGIWTCRIMCRATDRAISRQYVPKYNTLSGVTDKDPTMQEELIYLLCKSCDWRGEE